VVQEGQIYAALRVLLPHLQYTLLKDAAPTEYKEGKVVCPRCGSEEVEQGWFYPVSAKQSV